MTELPPDVPLYAQGFRSPSGLTVQFRNDWSKNHAVEDDGLSLGVYELFHKNNKARETQLSTVRLPDTVVFDHNFPRAWYMYDNENREIAKRPGRMLDAQTIYNHFSRGTDTCAIVAQFFHVSVRVEQEWESFITTREAASGVYDGQMLTYVEFLTAPALHDFLFQQRHKPDGVLQKFVLPKGEGNSRRNAELSVMWSPALTTAYGRTSRYRLDDRTLPLAVRATTYEGDCYHSDEVLIADETKHKLASLCSDIAAHFHNVERKRLTRLNAFFKVDDNNNVWFLWASSIRVAADALNPSSLRVPVLMNLRCEVVNGGTTTLERLQGRRRRQKQLLALDYELFQVSRDLEFALNMNASHRRQAKALDMKGLSRAGRNARLARVGSAEASKDPRYNSHHPLHESFVSICNDEDAGCMPQAIGDASAHATESELAAGSAAAARSRAASRAVTAESVLGTMSVEECVYRELAALAMDAWYAVYSTTLSECPKVMTTARVELAPPLVCTLQSDELRHLADILGLIRAQPGQRGTSTAAEELAAFSANDGNTRDAHDAPFYVVANHLVEAGRRLDCPSSRVEEETLAFFRDLMARRGAEVCEVCLMNYPSYFE